MDKGSSDILLDEPMDECSSFLAVELEALQSIYINEITIKEEEELKLTLVSIDLHPATADKLDEKYVRMTLEFIVTEGYPEEIPEIKIRNPRGLSEEKLNCISEELHMIAESKKGYSMLFEVIEAAKEHLTMGNRPSGECAICLYGFSDNDVFSRTPCYHYFHSHCLARYTKYFIESAEDLETEPIVKIYGDLKLLCPMCRIPIKFEAYEEHYPPPEASDDCDFVLTEEISEIQKRMADLYQKQVEKGGIIDIEAEKNKYLLEISNVPSRVCPEEMSDQKLTSDIESTAAGKTESVDLVESPNKEKKELERDHSEQSDSKSKNRNFNKPNNYRGNYHYDRRYNKQSYNAPRGNYNKNRYEKQSRYDKYSDINARQSNEASNQVFADVDNAASSDLTKNEVVTCSELEYCNASESSEKPSNDQRLKQNYDSSPRYNRGYRRGNYGNNSYGRGRRSNNSNFQERNNVPKYNSADTDDKFGSKREYDQRGNRTSDYDSRKSNYRSGNFRGGDNFYSSDRYSDRNSYRGNKAGYGRRDNYSHESSNYSRRGRYMDSGKEQHYSERDRNFRERRMPRDNRYRGNNTYDGSHQRDSRNYSGNRYGKSVNEICSQLPRDDNHESADVSSRSQSSDSNALSIENESLDYLTTTVKPKKLPETKNKTMVEKESYVSDKKEVDEKSGQISVKDENGLNISSNVFNEIRQGNVQTSVNPPPGFANPLKKVVYGLQGANPPPGFHRS